jgi:hypothetical protein
VDDEIMNESGYDNVPTNNLLVQRISSLVSQLAASTDSSLTLSIDELNS